MCVKAITVVAVVSIGGGIAIGVPIEDLIMRIAGFCLLLSAAYGIDEVLDELEKP